MVLRSSKFNDVYFSADNGLAETHHVFLNGNDLPAAWVGKKNYIVAETGFGTGLNFLATWKAFEETREEGQSLHFISFEKYPLSKDEIKSALQPWVGDFGPYIDAYYALYPMRVPGPHVMHVSSSVTLTVWFGDIDEVLPEWQGFQVDAWFLDGFTPAKNPEMWTDRLYNHMARLSYDQTTFASFTAAGHVRRGLDAAGFHVEKVKGFGHKRDMIKGVYSGRALRNADARPSVAIIGGGLAGCAFAYYADLNGMRATIYEASDNLAAGASGGKLGMINPRLTAKPTAHSDYYTAAFANSKRVLQGFDGIDYNIHGSLHLCTDEDKDRRFNGYIENLGWHDDHIQRHGDDLYYPEGASVSPEKLCHALVRNATIFLNQKVTSLDNIDADIIVLANSYAINDVLGEARLPVHSVRGQVSWIKSQGDIDKNICFGGYITPQTAESFHVLGSSFQPWETDCTLKAEDHKANIDRYNAVGGEVGHGDVIGGWAALRSSSKDRFPIVGHLKDNIYVSVAHGSHGIISSLMAAEIITSQLSGNPIPAKQSVLKALSPQRFFL